MGQRAAIGRPSRANLYRLADEGLADLKRVGGLPHPVEAQSIWRNIWIEETHNSTAIEGNTLTLRQVKDLLERGMGVGNKEMREGILTMAIVVGEPTISDPFAEPMRHYRASDG